MNLMNDSTSLAEMIIDSTMGNTTDIFPATEVTDIPAFWDECAITKNIRINSIPISMESGNQFIFMIEPGVKWSGFNKNPRMKANR